MSRPRSLFFFFFFNDTATTEIYTLSLHDALPIYPGGRTAGSLPGHEAGDPASFSTYDSRPDRKSTRLNSSHVRISYAVFCLKKKKKTMNTVNISTKKKVCIDKPDELILKQHYDDT